MNQQRSAVMAVRLPRTTPDRPIPLPQDGYSAGQEVRWKQRSRWRHGHLADPPMASDGSLNVYDDDFNGGARTLRAADVERLVRGPRGGRRWVACAPPQGDLHQGSSTPGASTDRPSGPLVRTGQASGVRAADRLARSATQNDGLGL